MPSPGSKREGEGNDRAGRSRSTQGVCYPVSAPPRKTQLVTLSCGTYQGRSEGITAPGTPQGQGRRGQGGRERNSHCSCGMSPSQGSGLTTRGIKPSPLHPTPRSVFTPWSMNSSALLVDPPAPPPSPVSTWGPTPHAAALHLSWMWWEQPGPS